LDGLPDQLQYYTDADRKIPKESNGKELFAQACIINDYLQNLFLVDRVSIARGFPNEERLFNTAMELLDMSLMFWMERDKLAPFTSSFDWIVSHNYLPTIAHSSIRS